MASKGVDLFEHTFNRSIEKLIFQQATHLNSFEMRNSTPEMNHLISNEIITNKKKNRGGSEREKNKTNET